MYRVAQGKTRNVARETSRLHVRTTGLLVFRSSYRRGQTARANTIFPASDTVGWVCFALEAELCWPTIWCSACVRGTGLRATLLLRRAETVARTLPRPCPPWRKADGGTCATNTTERFTTPLLPFPFVSFVRGRPGRARTETCRGCANVPRAKKCSDGSPKITCCA